MQGHVAVIYANSCYSRASSKPRKMQFRWKLMSFNLWRSAKWTVDSRNST